MSPWWPGSCFYTLTYARFWRSSVLDAPEIKRITQDFKKKSLNTGVFKTQETCCFSLGINMSGFSPTLWGLSKRHRSVEMGEWVNERKERGWGGSVGAVHCLSWWFPDDGRGRQLTSWASLTKLQGSGPSLSAAAIVLHRTLLWGWFKLLSWRLDGMSYNQHKKMILKENRGCKEPLNAKRHLEKGGEIHLMKFGTIFIVHRCIVMTFTPHGSHHADPTKLTS